MKARFFDLILWVLVLVFGAGGVPWPLETPVRWLLPHGADSRRAFVILMALGYFFSAELREKSIFLGWAQRAILKLTQERRARWGLLLAGVGCAILISVLQTLALQARLYDVGIFHQLLWSLSQGHSFHSSISGAGNFLFDHTVFSLALLVPYFRIFGESPLFLSVVHPLMMGVGVAAWLYFAEKKSPRLGAYAVLVILSFESFWGNLEWGFHENVLAFAALSWAFVLMLRARETVGSVALCYGLLCIAAASKEILLLDVALALSGWAVLRYYQGKKKWVDWCPQLGLAALLVLGFVYFEKLPHIADKNYFLRYYSYLGTGLDGFFKTLLTEPWKIVEAIGAKELLKYAGVVFVPWLGLPLFSHFVKWDRTAILLLSMLPSFASAALSTYPPLRGSGYHYVLELWPVLAIFTLSVLAWLPHHRKFKTIAWYPLWLFVSLLIWESNPWASLKEYARGAMKEAPVRALIQTIPSYESVIAEELAGTWVAGRFHVTRYPSSHFLKSGCPNWWVLKVGQTPSPHCPAQEAWRVNDWIAFKAISPDLIQLK